MIGFVANWKKIMIFAGLKEDDLKVLIAKGFLIPFESGVIVIRHWRMNNYLQRDRTKPTIYQEEFNQLQLDENNVYNLDTSCIHRLDKIRLDKIRSEENIDAKLISNESDKTSSECEEIINYLNLKLKSNFKASNKKSKEHISARLREGFKIEDFKKVIDKKYDEWRKDPKMVQYLRPETLFGTKFESYLNTPNGARVNRRYTQREYEDEDLNKYYDNFK